MQSTLHRFLGIVLLLEFILFDCLRLFFIFLTGCHSECVLFNLISWQMVPSSWNELLLHFEKLPSMPSCPGTGMLTCVPPFLSQTLVAHTLKNYIKVDTNIIFVLFDIFVITKIMAISQGIPGHLCGNPLPHPLCRQY